MVQGLEQYLRKSPLTSIAAAFLIQSIATQFILHVVPSFLRKAGYPPEIVGLIFLAFMPYAFRFAWAPLVDRYGSARMGHRRSWIVLAQVGVMVCASLFLLVDPVEAALPVIAASALLVVVVATQGTATGGYMVTALAPASRVGGASIQAASAGLAGLVVGVGLYLVGDLGWRPVIYLFGMLTVLGLVVLVMAPFDRGEPAGGAAVSAFASFTMFRRPEVRGLLGALLFIEAGLLLAQGMKPIVQVDAGMSMASIGVLGIFGGNLAGLAGAALAAPVVARLGSRRVLIALLGASCLLNAGLALNLGEPSPAVAVTFVLCSSLISFAYFTASRSLVLGICNTQRAATELSTFLCISNVFMLALASIGTMIAGRFGTQAPFMLSAGIALAAAIWMMIGSSKELNALWDRRPSTGATGAPTAAVPEN
ncbi:MFS transporter [Phreatobacter stygius]|nr:MFS transporter [Phreatobacter stygius]